MLSTSFIIRGVQGSLLLLLSAVAIAGCSADPALDAELGAAEAVDERGDALAGTRVRIVAANISSGNNQSYDPGHGTRILQGIEPDIVLIQEFNYGDNSAARIRSFVDSAVGPGFSYYREGGAQIPNGILSRWPIVESGEWKDPSVSNRDFAWARIDLPGPVDLWAVSVHLLTSSAGARNNEAVALAAAIRQKVPRGDYLVIGGDFNTSSRSEPCISTLSALVETSGPYPADQRGNTNTNSARSKPYDWVLVDDDLDPYETPVVLGLSRFESGLVVDTRVYSPLGEISPALAGDSGASNMQHMAVVRDFLIPAGAEPEPEPEPGAAVVLINEVLANEPGSNPDGEFIEVVNAGGAAADLSGWTLSDAVSTRHTFAAGTTLPPGAAIVVYGRAAAIPSGVSRAVGASTGTLGLTNGSDSVTLKDGFGTTIDGLTYSSSLSGTDGVSMNRNPDGSPGAPFVLHTALNGSSPSSSPGKRANGGAF